MVRGKFQVTDITHHRYPGITIKLMAIYDSDLAEDRSFSKATPTAHVEMLITNEAAMSEFELGKYFYVDFTAVEG